MYKIKVPRKFNAATGVKFFLYIGDWSNGMIGVKALFILVGRKMANYEKGE